MELWRQELYASELYHYGVPGMKPGVRRYQNEDGSLTALGRIHYGVQGFDTRRFDTDVQKQNAALKTSTMTKQQAARIDRGRAPQGADMSYNINQYKYSNAASNLMRLPLSQRRLAETKRGTNAAISRQSIESGMDSVKAAVDNVFSKIFGKKESSTEIKSNNGKIASQNSASPAPPDPKPTDTSLQIPAPSQTPARIAAQRNRVGGPQGAEEVKPVAEAPKTEYAKKQAAQRVRVGGPQGGEDLKPAAPKQTAPATKPSPTPAQSASDPEDAKYDKAVAGKDYSKSGKELFTELFKDKPDPDDEKYWDSSKWKIEFGIDHDGYDVFDPDGKKKITVSSDYVDNQFADKKDVNEIMSQIISAERESARISRDQWKNDLKGMSDEEVQKLAVYNDLVKKKKKQEPAG